MLVQKRPDSLWLITQIDHALLSGELCHNWWGLDKEAQPMHFGLQLAATLHDLPWLDADQAPTWNPDTKRPYSFLDYPMAERQRIYEEGLQRLEKIDPYVALLVSHHYINKSPSEAESDRRIRLRRQLGIEEGDKTLARHIDYLRLFDNLSLYICLAPPTAEVDDLPPWMNPAVWARTPKGTEFTPRWWSDEKITFVKNPFSQQFETTLRVHVLGKTRFESEAELSEAWENAETFQWKLAIG
ncbi:MAG: DUF3891 family protein [Myxococcales bacterium]|nr:DUF3891 family protein [Myxococcales bacterium]